MVTGVRAIKGCTTFSVSSDMPFTGGGNGPNAHTEGG